MVEGGMKCVKYLLFSFNLIFVIAAIALIAVGAYVQVKLVDYVDFFGNEYTGPGILLIVVGALIFIIAFFGCMGALKENYCLTMTYAVLLAVIFILMIAGGIAAYVLRAEIEDEVVSVLTKAEKNYGVAAGVTQAWDRLQREFECCGVKSYTEWQELNLTTTYPQSCCKSEESQECSHEAKIPESAIKTKPCEKAFSDFMREKVAIIGGVGIGLAFIMVVGVLFACCLARAIRREYEVV
ncbi:CD63 antigen-like [Babylonia areolata]|uniref:CD63 antigen-like n=1 Tax=Babylonia areolata TaxID=304850 RepID=UPI003FD0FC3B